MGSLSTEHVIPKWVRKALQISEPVKEYSGSTRTWGRRLLGARIRRPAPRSEVRTSLADTHIQPSKTGALPGRS